MSTKFQETTPDVSTQEQYAEWRERQERLESKHKSEIDDARIRMDCEVCGYPLVQKHRMVPGELGGCYTWRNVVFLCPTHHRMAHLFYRVYRAKEEEGFEEASDYDIDVFHSIITGADPEFLNWWEGDDE